MKIPGMRSEEQYKAFRRVLLVRSRGRGQFQIQTVPFPAGVPTLGVAGVQWGKGQASNPHFSFSAHSFSLLTPHARLIPSLQQGLNCAAVLSNMDRVDMSVGIIPITREMGWDKGTAGAVQSAFFQGFLLSQVR